MRNVVAIKAKAKAHNTCQECGSTELIQAHHEILGDDDSLVALCAECHSRKHPDLPKALFFNKSNQPYWHNKSAASLARELGVHPRTVIRAAKKLDVLPGKLSVRDERLIKRIVSIRMAVLRDKRYEYLTASQACQRLRFSRFQFNLRIKRGIFPRPTFVDNAGVRYFDEGWVRIAKAILDNTIQEERGREA